MVMKGFTCKRPHDMLTQDEVERIHYSTLQVLAKTGVVFDHKEALAILKEAGCDVDFEKKLAKMPAWLVEDSVRKAPSSFIIKSRNPKRDLNIGGLNTYFSAFPGFLMADLETGQRRPATIKDEADMVRLLDALENVASPFNPVLGLMDKHPLVSIEWLAATVMRNTDKITVGGSFFNCSKWVVRLAQATGQEVYGGVTPTPPLTYPQEQVDGLLIYARAGFPVSIDASLHIGATGPMTLAGSLVQHNAENLAGIVLAQLVKPGTRVLYGSYTQIMDMRYGTLAPGAVENGIFGSALAQLARYYRVPSTNFYPMTDSKLPDQQTGYEKTMQLLLSAMSGTNLIRAVGGTDDENRWDPVQAVIDNEACGMVGRILDGILVNDETLAVDLIDEVGPIPGTFLNKQHTRSWWRTKEIYKPTLSDRHRFDRWTKEGSKDVVTRAREKAKEIIRTHQPNPLPADVDREVGEILKACEREKLAGLTPQ